MSTTVMSKVHYFNKASDSDGGDRLNLLNLARDSLSHYESGSTLRICAISDTFGKHELLGVLPSCDILIFSGNMLDGSKSVCEQEAREQLQSFNAWLGKQPTSHVVVVAGDHDHKLDEIQAKIHTAGVQKQLLTNATYLCNSFVTIDGLNIVGIPFSKDSGAGNCGGFQSSDFARQTQDYLHFLAEKEVRVDILVTHGSCEKIAALLKPRLGHFSGHTADTYGVTHVARAAACDGGVGSGDDRTHKKPEDCSPDHFRVVSTILSEGNAQPNLPIVFDCDRC